MDLEECALDSDALLRFYGDSGCWIENIWDHLVAGDTPLVEGLPVNNEPRGLTFLRLLEVEMGGGTTEWKKHD
jgi:hypothetical protein